MRRKALAIKVEGAVRGFLASYGTGRLGAILVTEYPKSGGSWFGEMLSGCLGRPFPRNRLPLVRRAILHGHYRYRRGMRKVFVVIRDGRDVMVSFYYHSLFVNERFNDRLVAHTQKALGIRDPLDIERNLPRFMEFKFVNPRHPRFSWSDFVDDWYPRGFPIVKYEQLLADPFQVVSSALETLNQTEVAAERVRAVIARNSFEAMSKRSRGTENRNSFLRKGVAGDWRNHFSREAKEMFDHFAGEQLLMLGYERDRRWIAS